MNTARAYLFVYDRNASPQQTMQSPEFVFTLNEHKYCASLPFDEIAENCGKIDKQKLAKKEEEKVEAKKRIFSQIQNIADMRK